MTTDSRPKTSTRPRTRAWWATLPIAAIVLTGCGQETTEPTDEEQTSSAAPVDDAAASSAMSEDQVIAMAGGVLVPEGATGAAMTWLIDTMNSAEAVDADAMQERFAPSFLDAITTEDFSAGLDQIRGNAPMRVTSIEPAQDSLTADIEGTEALVLNLALDEDGLISELTFSADALADRPAPEGYEQIEEELSAVSQQRNILAARIEDGQCVPIFEHESTRVAPAASAFKLYVLGAVVDAVERGDLTWSEELTVTEEVKSLPSGTLQDEPDGTTLSVQQAAELMMSISDNTATDLLIAAIGQEEVEDVYFDMGLSESNVDGLTPLPTTAQMFQLGWGVDDDIRQQWSAADTQAQRQILADLPTGVADLDPSRATEPRWQDGVDWFVSAADLCSAHVALQERAQTPAGEPLRAILSEASGRPDVVDGFDYVAFKDGALPGQSTWTWYGEIDDVAVVAIIQVASDDQIPPTQVLGPAIDILTLLKQDATTGE